MGKVQDAQLTSYLLPSQLPLSEVELMRQIKSVTGGKKKKATISSSHIWASCEWIVALMSHHHCYWNVTSLSSSSLHLSLQFWSLTGLRPAGAKPGSSPFMSRKLPLAVWAGTRKHFSCLVSKWFGARRLGIKSPPRDHTATKLKGEPTNGFWNSQISMLLWPWHSGFPFWSHCSQDEWLVSLGLRSVSECEFLFFF